MRNLNKSTMDLNDFINPVPVTLNILRGKTEF